MNRKGIYIPALAFLAIVIGLIILLATLYPPFKQSLIDILKTIFGKT